MFSDLDDYLTDDLQAHPRARELMNEGSAVLWAGELGPLGSDRGHDALYELCRWWAENPNAGLNACIDWIVSGWDEGTIPASVDDDVLAQQLARDAEDDFDFYQEVYVLDETVIVSALGQLLLEGRVDADALERVEVAIARESHPLVLARIIAGEDNIRTRLDSLREARRLIRAAAV